MEFLSNGFQNLWYFIVDAAKEDFIGIIAVIAFYFLLSRTLYHFRGRKSKFDALDRGLFGSLVIMNILYMLISMAGLMLETFDNSPGMVKQMSNITMGEFIKPIVILTVANYIISRFSKKERDFDKEVKEASPRNNKEYDKEMKKIKDEYNVEFNETVDDIKNKVKDTL